tara:strand:- start:870 stop:998 length:129 start_codon:yes stop_codon:yes gene_type:complete
MEVERKSSGCKEKIWRYSETAAGRFETQAGCSGIRDWDCFCL